MKYRISDASEQTLAVVDDEDKGPVAAMVRSAIKAAGGTEAIARNGWSNGYVVVRPA